MNGQIIHIEDGKIEYDAAAALKAIGGKDPSFIIGIVTQLASLEAAIARDSDQAVAFLASIVAGIAPRDSTEALFATQMAGIHNSVILMIRRLAQAQTIMEQDSSERALNKLARTFAMQVEALQRYRGVVQTVRVEQVTVDAEEDALVGSAGRSKRGGKNDETKKLN